MISGLFCQHHEDSTEEELSFSPGCNSAWCHIIRSGKFKKFINCYRNKNDKEINRLKERVNKYLRLFKQAKAHDESFGNMAAWADSMQKELNEAVLEREELRKQVIMQKERADELEEELKSQPPKIINSVNSLERVNFQCEIHDLKRENERLEIDNMHLRQEITNVINTDRTAEEVKFLCKENHKLQEENARLKELIENQRRLRMDDGADIYNLEEENRALKKEIEALKKTFNHLDCDHPFDRYIGNNVILVKVIHDGKIHKEAISIDPDTAMTEEGLKHIFANMLREVGLKNFRKDAQRPEQKPHCDKCNDTGVYRFSTTGFSVIEGRSATIHANLRCDCGASKNA